MSQNLPISMLAELEEGAIMDLLAELTVERDTFKRMAAMYQQGYEETKVQLQQFQNLCFATQAELENERLLHPRSLGITGALTVDTTECNWLLDTDWASTAFTRKLFGQVEKLISKREHDKAAKKIDCQLRGSLSPEARLEGILLQCAILRYSSGEDAFSCALLKCKEALELCGRHPTLHSLRPKANFYKGVCLYWLKMYPEARIAFASIPAANFFGDKAKEYMERCIEEQSAIVSEDAGRFDSRRAEKLGEVEARLEVLKETAPEVSVSSVEARSHLALQHSLQDARTRQLTRSEDAEIRTFLDPFDIPLLPSTQEAYTSSLLSPSAHIPNGCDDLPGFICSPGSSAPSSIRSRPESQSASVSMGSIENSVKDHSAGLGILLPDKSSAGESKPRPNPYGRPPLELDDGQEGEGDDSESVSEFDYFGQD